MSRIGNGKMTVLKNIFGLLAGLLIFVLFTIYQYSLIVLVKKKEYLNRDIWYVYVYLILVCPEITYLLAALWKSSFIAKDRYKQWPELKILLMGLVLTTLESVLTSYLFSELLPKTPSFTIPVLLLSIAFPNILKYLSGNKTRSRIVLAILGAIFIVGSIVTSIILGLLEMFTVIECILLTSFIWIISVSHYKPLRRVCMSSNSAPKQNCRILFSLSRTVSLTVTLYFCATNSENTLQVLSVWNTKGFLTRMKEIDELYILLIIILCSFILQFYRFVAIRTRRSYYAWTLPLCFSVAAVMALSATFCLCDIQFLPILKELGCQQYFGISWEHLMLYIICVLNVLALPVVIFLGTFSSDSLRIVRFDSSYSSLFFISNVFSDYFDEGEKEGRNFEKSKKTRIFVCTTMYQEAKHEMNRLLKSIHSLSDCKDFVEKDVYLESHIFLDNGASEKELKEFGIQLLSLIEHNFEVEGEYGTMKYTPYGAQLSWEVPRKIPVFIHIKDTSKVKAKKRWSQVMYMNYILRFRSKYLERAESMHSPISDSLESLDVGIFVDSSHSSPGGSEVNHSNTLHVPTITFDMGSKTSSYSSLTTISHLDEQNRDLEENELGDEVIDAETRSLDETRTEVTKLDDLYTEHSFRFDGKSMMTENRDNTIFTISDTTYRNESRIQYDDYILATDADMSFDCESVINLLNTCQRNPDVGGVCGRTYPIGVHWHPIVWLQMFDYAKDFWMIKSAQNVIGSVMCCPGCFSLYRFEAVRDVIDTYSEPTTSMEDIFTKDNGEDRWMCTLMMLKGWSLRYNAYGRNSTYCPEETEEFMKQRRRWLLSDFANAIVVARNIGSLMGRNTCFTLLYAIYILQLFLVMILYPGSTIMMLALGFELVTGAPLLANVGVLTFLIIAYCLVLVSRWSPTRKLVVSKLMMLSLGALTMYVFIATAVVIARNMREDFSTGTISHLQNFVLVGVAATYLYSALIHPTEVWLLCTGVIYLFYLPLLNVILPLYAVCNIIDQSWGTRDDQVASVPSILRIPKFKRKRKKKPSIKVRYGSYVSLSSSALDLSDTNQSETEFWKHLIQDLVGINANLGISQTERNTGLRMLRNRALVGYLGANIVWLVLLCGFYAFLINNFENKTVYGIVVIAILGISPFIQLTGMTVYKINDLLSRIASWLS